MPSSSLHFNGNRKNDTTSDEIISGRNTAWVVGRINKKNSNWFTFNTQFNNDRGSVDEDTTTTFCDSTVKITSFVCSGNASFYQYHPLSHHELQWRTIAIAPFFYRDNPKCRGQIVVSQNVKNENVLYHNVVTKLSWTKMSWRDSSWPKMKWRYMSW